jgi:hypothetical protein
MTEPGCLGVDTLVELVEGCADQETLDRVFAHASICDTCRDLLSVLARGDMATGATLAAHDALPSVPPSVRANKRDLGTRIGRYELEKLLGIGGMGYVYVARDPELDRRVALKLLRPGIGGGEAQLAMQARLRREAQAMALLAHPHVVSVYDVGVYEDRVFIAMELVEGETLSQWLAAEARRPREILDVFIAAGRGLAAAHAAGLIHRDFKPENVLVGRDGRARVGDFGLARSLHASRAEHNATLADDADRFARLGLTRTGAIMGTPLYMAPEQYRDEPVDARTDQFSFCVALHGAIYGARPFAGSSFAELAAAVTAGRMSEPTTKPRVARRVRDAVRRGMAVSPKERWPSMEALIAELVVRPARARWLAPVIAGAGVAAIAAAMWSGGARGCGIVDLDKAWNEPRKAQIRAALRGTGLPYAARTAVSVIGLGDDFEQRWKRLRTGACTAGKQSKSTYQLARICFRLRKHDLSALGDQLINADARIAAHAVAAMQALVGPEVCQDDETLGLLFGPIDDTQRTAINSVIDRLHAIRAARSFHDDGADTRKTVEEVVAQARSLPDAVRAEVDEVAGTYALTIGDDAHAETWLADAVTEAERGRKHPVAQASALVGLLTIAHRRHTYDAARYTRAVDVIAGKFKAHPEIELAYLIAKVRIDEDRDQLRLDDLSDARVFANRAFPSEVDLHRAAPLYAMVEILTHRRAAEATSAADQLLASVRRAVGDTHPEFARALIAAGDAQASIGDRRAATVSYARAREIADCAKDTTTRDVARARLGELPGP